MDYPFTVNFESDIDRWKMYNRLYIDCMLDTIVIESFSECNIVR